MIKALILASSLFGVVALAQEIPVQPAPAPQPYQALYDQNQGATGIQQCTGYDSRTLALVTGQCNGTSFTGYDQRTLAFVSGTCTGTSFSGYDSRTLAYCYGNCQ